MIGTLFMQEIRSTWKTMLTAVGIAVLVAALSLTMAALRIPLLGDLGFGLGVLAVVLISPIVLGLLTEHYWRTMYGREGYFTMAIPVRGRTLFTAKVLYGVVATLIALVITLIGVAATLVAFAMAQGTSISLAYEGLWNTLAVLDSAVVWFLAGCAVLQFVGLVVAGATVMSIGAEGRFNQLGFGAPVIGGLIVYIAMQVVGLAATLFFPLGLEIAGPGLGTFVAEGMIADFIAILGNPAAEYEPTVVGLGMVPVTIVATVLLGWWGARSVERRTSLR